MRKSLKNLAIIGGTALSMLLFAPSCMAQAKNPNFSVNNSLMSEAESTVNTIPKISQNSNQKVNQNQTVSNNNIAQQRGLHDGRDYNVIPNRYRQNVPYAKSYVLDNRIKSNDQQVKSYQGYRSSNGHIKFNHVTSDPSLARSYNYGVHASNHEYHYAFDQKQSKVYERALFKKSNLDSSYWSPYRTSILYFNGNQVGKFGSGLFMKYPYHKVICFNHSKKRDAYGYHGYLNGIMFAKKHNNMSANTMKHLKKYLHNGYYGSSGYSSRYNKEFRKHYVIKNISHNEEHSYPNHYLIYNKRNRKKSAVIYIIPYGLIGELPKI